MYDVLKQHAINNVWCSPEQDNQILLAPARVTPKHGVIISFQHMMRSIVLPTKTKRFHVFHIGQAHPFILGLLRKIPDWSIEGWTLFSTAVEKLTVYCDLYTDDGVHIPLHRSYYMYTNDHALIIAIDAGSGSPIDYTSDKIYLRLYTNAYFESTEAKSLTTDTRAVGGTIDSTDDIVKFQNQLTAWASLPGKSLSFINGQYVNTIDLKTSKVGDVVEIFHDTSIKTVFDIAIKDAPVFTSTLDACFKYLLHPVKDDEAVVNYYDDIDIYLVAKTEKGEVGHYYHRNRKTSVRMLTHRDYSLRVDHVKNIGEALSNRLGETPIELHELVIRVFVRHGGITRPLIHDHQRVFELYKLKESVLLGAMVGDEATIPYWSADALESSYYTALMRANYKDIGIDLINDAYGYNSITQIIGETPSIVEPYAETGIASLPPVLQANSTMYEYDKDGALLGFYSHLAGDTCLMQNAETTLVEGVVGKGKEALIKSTGQDNLPIPSKFSYRVYMCYLVNGHPNNVWKDITGSNYYTIENGLLKWTGLETDQWLELRSDESFLAYEIEAELVNGLLFFSLAENANGEAEILSIPLGDLDIWLNGKPVIENLDYRVEFPKVSILNKEFLKLPAETEKQKITVRMTGFCNKDLSWKQPEDYGFIEHGVLSNNNRFDVRDDKVLRITVGGSYRSRKDLIFSEEHTGVSVVNALNGIPYQIKDVVVPLRDLTDDETYALRAKSIEVDTAVEDYMSLKLPQPPREGVMAIASRWTLVSPFFARIASDIVTKVLSPTLFEKVLSDGEVLEICKPYESYLSIDPLNTSFNTDFRFIEVHPTGIKGVTPLSLEAYRFMQKVMTLYGRNQITLSSHFTVSLGG